MEIDILQKFKSETAIPYIKEILLKTAVWFYAHKYDLKKQYLNDLKQIFGEGKRFNRQTGKKISYFAFTLLRTNLLYGKNVYDVYVYDEDWYLNDYTKIGEIDASVFFKPLERVKLFLYDECKKYIGKINASNVDNFVSQALELFGILFIKMLRYIITDITELQEYKDLEKADNFQMYAGELYGVSYGLYHETKEKYGFDQLLDEFNADTPCQLYDLRNSQFSGKVFSGGDLTYSDLRNSELQSISFEKTILDGVLFNNCRLSASSFRHTQLNEASFQDADLRGTDWFGVSSMGGINKLEGWRPPGNLPMNVDGADMREAIIRSAVLVGVDFTHTRLDNARFDNSYLLNCIFEKGQVSRLNLNENQLRHIKIQ